MGAEFSPMLGHRIDGEFIGENEHWPRCDGFLQREKPVDERTAERSFHQMVFAAARPHRRITQGIADDGGLHSR